LLPCTGVLHISKRKAQIGSDFAELMPEYHIKDLPTLFHGFSSHLFILPRVSQPGIVRVICFFLFDKNNLVPGNIQPVPNELY